MKKIHKYFSKKELILYFSSILIVIIFFTIFDRKNYLTLIASIIGTTSLIFSAKGNPIGPILMIFFSLLYGYISLSFAYYGEMLTYLGMSAPMSILALISWLKNPYKGNKSQVKVDKLRKNEIWLITLLSFIVTVIFYFILKAFNTTNLLPSTLSVTTSFIAVYLTYRRSPFFALAYALNDMVLIVLWILATISNISYISVTICFIIFFVNDLYGFYSWLKMSKKQID